MKTLRRHKVAQAVQGRSVRSESRSGRPSTSWTDDNVTRVRDLLNKDRRMSVSWMSEQLNFPKTDVNRIVSEDLTMRKIFTKLETKVLSNAQKQQRVEVCNELLELCE
ncbi:hypothetical protein LAZ67_2006314 [Cordylochernes scorpioides]|uniref:Uncharacterized protein n=1 Tax=Cordylochernes scorpioides TaxID=51811 RepID=A0ABY6K8H4_9ARAC|nr:hypothetical protein LAZ67_2006314 [Cordylochernes scorpioides]